ncbi:hypothetical protein FAM19317_01045 [Lacticaseibacillus paracasei]|nr:hypothetical protein FAM19317_01045 [Lacticaseibacillus paracasei]RNE40768.1 hypothetical protein FAM8140_01033 [Lacticaseibacillus paracasei]
MILMQLYSLPATLLTLGLLTIQEYHYHDKNVVAGKPC